MVDQQVVQHGVINAGIGIRHMRQHVYAALYRNAYSGQI